MQAHDPCWIFWFFSVLNCCTFFFWPCLHVVIMLTQEWTEWAFFFSSSTTTSNKHGYVNGLLAILPFCFCWHQQQQLHCLSYPSFNFHCTLSVYVEPPPLNTFALSSWRSGLKSKFHFALSFDSLSAPWRWCLNNFFSFIMKRDKD